MANLEIEIERSHSGIEWFRAVLYFPTVVGWRTRVYGKAWSSPKIRWSKDNRTDTK